MRVFSDLRVQRYGCAFFPDEIRPLKECRHTVVMDTRVHQPANALELADVVRGQVHTVARFVHLFVFFVTVVLLLLFPPVSE